MLRGYLVVFCFWGYFGHFLRLRGYFQSFLGSRVFWFFFFLSFQGILVTFWLRVYIGHFLMPRGYLIHFQPLGAFWSSSQAKVFLVIFRFRWLLVFFQISMVFWSFFRHHRYISSFSCSGVFQPFFGWYGCFGHFFKFIRQVGLFLVLEAFQSFSRIIKLYFINFGLFLVPRVFWSF